MDFDAGVDIDPVFEEEDPYFYYDQASAKGSQFLTVHPGLAA